VKVTPIHRSLWSGFGERGHAITVDHIGPSMRTDQFRLPPDLSDFIGRDEAVREIQHQLDDPNGSPVVSSIAGRAGVGKTALAIRVARNVRDSFPDAQLYVNLGAPDDRPVTPDDLLAEILLELGVARSEIKEDLTSRTNQYREQLEYRKVLLVLDNATERAQVEPLLPNSHGSAALVTSRAQLGRLEATPSVVTHSMVLDVLDEERAVALLAHTVGDDRVSREPTAARRIVELCGYLPLAVRIAGARLAGSRRTSLASLASRLADEQVRLSEPGTRDLEVRASFALNYQALQKDERRLFRLLGVIKAPDFPDWVAAALLDCDLDLAQDLIRRLVTAEVLAVARQAPNGQSGEAPTGQARYRFHDLLRVLAVDHLQTEEPEAAQDAALGRVLTDSLELATRAAELLEPGTRKVVSNQPPPARLSDAVQRLSGNPAAWFDDERVSLLAAVDQADASRRREVTWELARVLSYYFKLRTHWTDWHRTQQLALRAARREGDERATANALRSLGDVHTQLGQLGSAVTYFEEALQLFRRVRAQEGLAWTLFGLGGALHEQGQYDRAVELLQNAIVLFRDQVEDIRGEGWALGWLGIVRRYQGKLEEAYLRLLRSLELLQEVGDRRGEAYCLVNLGAVHRDRQQYDAAVHWLDQAEPIFGELNDQQGAAYLLLNKGHILRDQGRYHEAVGILTTCLQAMRRLGDRPGEAWTRFNLGMVQQAQGRADQAMDEFDDCRRLFSLIPDDRGTAWTLIGVGHVQLRRNQIEEAITSFRQAVGQLPDGDELGQAKALSGLGQALASNGEPVPAMSSWRSALEIFRRLDSREAMEVEAWLDEWG
jgi:tetratricopeptide (TPR) repeat protein